MTRLFVLCFVAVLSLLQPCYAQRVDLDIRTNWEIYRAGDTFEVYVSLENNGAAFDAELYVAIDCFGTLLFLPRLTTDVLPLFSGYYPPGFRMSDSLVFSMLLPEGIPEADYIVKSAVLAADTYSFESDIAERQFSFQAQGASGIEGRNEYLPLAEGYSWTYLVDGEADGGEGTAVVEEARESGNVYEFSIFQESDTDIELILADDDGDIFVRDIVVDGDSMCSKDQLIIPEDMDTGDSWTVWFVYDGWPIVATVRVEGRDDITVPAGDFEDCRHLEVSTLFDVVSADLWFARYVGLVKGRISASIFDGGSAKLMDYDFTRD